MCRVDRVLTAAWLVSVIFAFSVVTTRTHADQPAFTGVVEQVIDGDTIYVRDIGGKLRHVRINWIDAPEPGQKWATESKASLKRETLGKRVRVYPYRDEDPLPSDVYLGGIFLSEKRLRDGWAWNYVPHSTEKELIAAEARAKTSKRGMWQDENLEPPWEFRRKKEATALSTKAAKSDQPAKAEKKASTTDSVPIERKLAVVNGAISAADEKRDAAKFSDLLDSLHRKCPSDSREEIADMSFKAWEMLKERNVDISLLALMAGLDFSIPDEAAGRFKFKDFAAMSVIQLVPNSKDTK